MRFLSVDNEHRGRFAALNSFSIKDFAVSKRVWAVCIGVIVALSAGLCVLVWLIQKPDRPLADFRSRFDALRTIEAGWDAELLSLQLGIARNYDAVTRTAADLKRGLKELSTIVNSNESLAPLKPTLAGYQQTIDAKDRLSEQVKASYAMLRNSVAVMPSAIADAYAQPGILAIINGPDKRISDLVTETITAMVSFTISPTPLLRDAVQLRIDSTRAAAKSLSPTLANAIERFLAQTEVVIRERQRGNALMLQTAAVPSDAAVIDLQAQLSALEAEQGAGKQRLWELAIINAVLLLLASAAFVAVLWQRFARLNQENRVLQQANDDVEEQLMQSAKLSALGQMVAGITHEINTPLAYVTAVFELIKERLLESPDIIEDADGDEDEISLQDKREEMALLLEDGLHGLSEMAVLVKTMKNFSRLDKGNVESFSVEETIEGALAITRPQIGTTAEIRREFDAVPPIIGSASQLRQVLVNLIVNASDAMAMLDRRGRLTVRTRITSSDTVQIDICDNGPGMDAETLARIFDPFFTTKPVGQGTGMGLSICYRIVENHGGTITVNSQPGMGTVVTLTLPRQDEKFADAPADTDQATKVA